MTNDKKELWKEGAESKAQNGTTTDADGRLTSVSSVNNVELIFLYRLPDKDYKLVIKQHSVTLQVVAD